MEHQVDQRQNGCEDRFFIQKVLAAQNREDSVGKIEIPSEPFSEDHDRSVFSDLGIGKSVAIIVGNQDVDDDQSDGGSADRGGKGPVPGLYIVRESERNDPEKYENTDVTPTVIRQRIWATRICEGENHDRKSYENQEPTAVKQETQSEYGIQNTQEKGR